MFSDVQEWNYWKFGIVLYYAEFIKSFTIRWNIYLYNTYQVWDCEKSSNNENNDNQIMVEGQVKTIGLTSIKITVHNDFDSPKHVSQLSKFGKFYFWNFKRFLYFSAM